MHGKINPKKYLLISAGLITFSLGAIGVFLPILPTTPFLLLSAACFLRSSDRLYHWITHHRIFGNYIRCYIEYRAVTKKTKIVALLFLWSVIVSTILFFTELLWLRILLLVIATGVTIHLVTMRTLTKEMMNKRKAENPNESL